MQNDSMQISTSCRIQRVSKQAVPQESSAKSFQCSHCILIFKSKVYLFEHLNKVHGFDVDAALTEAGLKYIKANKANPDSSTSSTRSNFKCQHCNFKAFSRDILNEHEKQCQEKIDNAEEQSALSGTVVLSENPDTAITEISTNQHNEATEAEEISSVMSTSKAKCSSNSIKDLKTYKRPLQTITKYFTVSSGSNGKPPAKLADSTKGTLILQDSPSSSSPNSSGVFKVTAKSMIDISNKVADHFLRNEQHLMTDLSLPKPKAQLSETPPDNTGKRPNIDSSESRPAKKAKSDKETKLPKKEHTSNQLSLSSTKFSFDISEDEEERKGDLVNGDTESTDVYYCKHCDYSGVGIKSLSAHYQDSHPYVRYNAVYIQDAYDQSATFRCLKCPVKFLSTADLKWHYMENHPDAPDVFMMKACQLNLVFKCFVCSFTTNAVKVLREHYKVKHPAHKVDSSLFYCRYSVTEGEEEPSSCNSCEKTASSERSRGKSPERSNMPCTEDKNATSPQHPPSKGADMALYKCNKCKFSHKSVVVMHVHYQKSHPDEEITLQKIKQLACVMSEMTPEKSPNSGTVIEDLAPLKTTTGPSKDESEVSQQMQVSSFSEKNEYKAEASENKPETSDTQKVESVRDRSKRKKPSINYEWEVSAGTDSLPSSSPDKIFYCQFCSYNSPSVRSVVGHHNAKHSMDAPIGTDDIVWYSAEVQKMKNEMKASKNTPSSHSETTVKVEAVETEAQNNEGDETELSVEQFNPYACAENLFYCQKCNFGNPTLKGVINHQAKTHQRINTSRESVVEYTALVHDEIEKSKYNEKEFSFYTDLPLPIMNKGDEHMFFCHFCNYRNSTVKDVMRHYSKTHRGFEKKATQIQLYTSMVLRRTQKSHLKLEQEVCEVSPEKLENNPQTVKEFAFSVSAASPGGDSQGQRTLKCYRCSYSTPYVYLLKRHIRKTHLTIRSVTDVLRVCFKQGALESGYHCEFCIFSHENAEAVYKHYQEKHPTSKTSFGYISKRLYVGPNTDPPKRKKLKLKRTDGTSDGNGHDGNSSQRSGQKETKMYSCSTCSFKGNSMLSIARHCRAVHLLSAKEDYLDLQNSKKTNESSQKEDHDEEMPELFDSYQVPLEFDKSSDEAIFKCPYCSLSFNTQHGLSVHCGMKHHETEPKVSEEKPEPPVQVKTSLHIFKCPHCTYVNTIHQGVLTHCQMKHPTLPSRADSLDVDSTFVQNWDECSKKNGPGDIVRFSGHMCETCPQLCATLNKLRKHSEKDHNGTVSSIVQSVLKPSAVSQTVMSKSYSTQGSVSKASFLSKKINATIRCQQCSYTCRTKIELGRHLRVHHKNTISKDRVYKCALCSKIYFMTKRLAGHYAKKHGREAYLKYYIPMYKQGFEKPAPTSPDCTSTQQPQNTYEPPKSSLTTDKNKILAFRCPSCPYMNASYHGTLTHCQMKHPAVVARADELQTTEILLTNMLRCPIGKGSNQRGYMCKKCPQIHASLGKLKIHCRRDHDGMTVFEHSTETENKRHYGSEASVSDTACLNNETSEVNITEAEDCPQPDISEPCQSNAPSAEYKGLLYKCRMCSYAGSCRKYLYCHLKKTHKLDALTTYRMLENYNIRKRKMPSNLSVSAEPEESANVKCMMCPNLMFDSPQLLVDHYSTLHRLDCKLDFTMLSSGSKKKKTTGIYKCCHCATVLYGIRKLCLHLDRHTIGRKEMIKAARRKMPLVITPKPEFESIQVSMPNELPTLQTVEELIEWNVTPVETFTLPTSPLSSPSKHVDVERLDSREDKHACQQCGRTFMSMKGLRSHMRSHAALAAIKKLNKPSTSALEININKFIIHKVGTVKPFLCGLCSYRTTVMGLWRSHFMKKHRDIIADPAETHCKDEENALRMDREPSYSSEGFSNLLELDEETELAEESMYLEPPDVQRQLNHYNLVAQSSAKSKANVQESKLTENSMFYCEICNFNTGHLSSMRRHYVNRHGKKIFKCKDCNFFTGLRKTLEQHIETGHSTCQSEPTHQMDLRCPFCLYQTKNKNNMIDHIILHREERVVPIEVRRSKLSRYLQGIVFRCHKCTFTSGSEENLRSHMTRHDDIKPYKCRLCYFDCMRLSDLEAHLSDKHQVMRNHELVGQVSLDQLDAKFGSIPGNEEEHSSHLEEHYSDTDNAETEEFITEFNETENPTENNTREKITLQEAHWKRGQGGNEENPGNSHQHENAKPNTTVLKDPQKQAVIDTGSQNVKKTVGEGNNCLVEEGQTNDNQAQPRLKDGEGSSISEQNEKAAEGNSATYFQPPEKTQAHILHIKAFQPRTLDIEAKVEKDILRHILELDEDGSVCKIQKTANQDRAQKVEENIEAKGVDDDLGDIPLLDEEGSTTLVQNPKHPVNAQTVSASAKMNHAQAKNTSTPESLTIEKHLTLSPNCTQLLLSHKDILGVTCAISKHEKMNSLKNCEDVTEHYGEMPVLENEYLKHERPTLEPCKEQEEIDDLNHKDKESEMITEDNGEQCKGLEDPHVYKGAIPAIEGAAEVLRSSPAEDKPFTCEFCGRNLMNSSELQRHIMRHGI